MTLQAEEGVWTPEICLVSSSTGVVVPSGWSVTKHTPAPAGDCYGNYTRVGNRVWVDFCMEFTLNHSLATPALVMVSGLPYTPGTGAPVAYPYTTSGTNVGTLFISNHSRFSSAAIPALPAGMESMNCIVTPFYGKIHFEGFTAGYAPMLFTTQHFTSGQRRYIRGEVNYITNDVMPSED